MVSLFDVLRTTSNAAYIVACLSMPCAAQVKLSTTADRSEVLRARLHDYSDPYRGDDEEVMAFVYTAVASHDSSVRSAAFVAITIRLNLSVSLHVKRENVGRLLPAALKGLDDKVAAVRSAAIAAIVALAPREVTEVGVGHLSRESETALAARYRVETVGFPRAQIVAAFAGIKADSVRPDPVAEGVLLQALNDPDENNVVLASRAAARWRLTAALPTIVRLLRHPSSTVRLVEAQALKAYGEGIRSFASDIRTAFAVETDEFVLRALGDVLKALGQPRSVSTLSKLAYVEDQQ